MNPIRDLRKLANELEAISKISVEIAKVDSRTVAISGLPADVIALAEKALVEGEDSDSGLAMERRLDEIAGQLEVQGVDPILIELATADPVYTLDKVEGDTIFKKGPMSRSRS